MHCLEVIKEMNKSGSTLKIKRTNLVFPGKKKQTVPTVKMLPVVKQNNSVPVFALTKTED